MKTFKIVDGSLYIDPGTGQPVMVESYAKGGQDVERHLLCAYDNTFQEGNELINILYGSATTAITEVLATTFLHEAVNRLIIKQSSSFDGERVISINQLTTRNIGLSALAFYMEVRFLSGNTSEVVNFINLKPTSLNQLLNADAVLRV